MIQTPRFSRRRFGLGAAAAAAALAGCSTPATPPAGAPPISGGSSVIPDPPREFRAAWVATVVNIDWPSRPGLDAATLRTEALAILDRAAALNLNALILQVRPAGDAIYPSALEPWSEYLTGEQGRPPPPFNGQAWDPLAFWIDEAHRRGIELHAWLNPYRARHPSARTPLVAPHIAVRAPEAVKRYGELMWMDPAEPAAEQQTLAVVADLVRRYDLDGLHIDDYFYPYPVSVNGVETPFPDDAAWARYRMGGGTLEREDWRRANVDRLVQAMHRTVREARPHLRFGISPFGIGKPGRRPPGITGFSQYDKLYADVEKWIAEGWLDYLAPQLYWPIDRVGQQFPVLLDHWLAESRGLPADPARVRPVWSGLYTSLVTRNEPGVPLGPRAWPAQEIVSQIGLMRERPAADGHIHFSMAALMQDRDGIVGRLSSGPYASAALVPPAPWLAGGAPLPAAPLLVARGERIELVPGSGTPARYALWRRSDAAAAAPAWRLEVLPEDARHFERRGAGLLALAALDRFGRLGPWAVLS